MVAEFDRRRRVVLDGINQAPGLTCLAIPMGAFYVFVRHRVPGMDAADLCNYLLDKAGVATVPGLPFGPSGRDYLRISYATSLQNCQKGMQRIAEVMKTLN
jgi:aspartate/methionine/tyrosine aminotransferase